jgi:HEAT repeat protein
MGTRSEEAKGGFNLTWVARALDSEEAEERRQATFELGRAPIEEALPLLLRALGDEDWRVRKEATLVGRSFGGAGPLVSALLEVFAGAEDVGLRNAAVEVLAGAGHAATTALTEALPNLNADGRKLAVETLGRSQDPSAIEALERALDDADDNVREAAIEAIAGLGERARDKVAEILMGRLDDRDRLVRLAALEGLTALEVPIPWSRLAPLLEQSTLRTAALSAAALADSPEAARALADVLLHAGARGAVFDQALSALGRLAEGPLGPSIALALRTAGPELGKRLVAAASREGQMTGSLPGAPRSFAGLGSARGGGPTARRAMALRLAGLAGAPGVVDVSIDALGEDLLADAAQRSLLGLGAAGLPEMVARLADESVPSEARASLVDVVAETIAQAGVCEAPASSSALPALRHAITSPPSQRSGLLLDAERQVAVRALRALARHGGEEDLALVAEQTLDASPAISVAAEGALAALGARFPAPARALAVRLMADPTRELPAAILVGALSSTSRLDEGDAMFLAHAATAGDPRARRAAVEAVSALRASAGAGYPAALEVLGFALTDEEHEVQIAAARALGRLCSAPDAPRASDVLDLVDRSGQGDLVAATVRAIGDGMSAAATPSLELVSALALFARGAPSQVAIAAVDSLAHAQHAGTPVVAALASALDHPDEAVVKAGVLKLSTMLPAGDREQIAAGLAKALAHASVAVRVLAAEALGEHETDVTRAELVRRLGVESDARVEEAIRRALLHGGEGGSPR